MERKKLQPDFKILFEHAASTMRQAPCKTWMLHQQPPNAAQLQFSKRIKRAVAHDISATLTHTYYGRECLAVMLGLSCLVLPT